MANARTQESHNNEATEGASTHAASTDAVEQKLEAARKQANETLAKLQGQVRQLDVDGARSKLERWVEQNPTLAVLLAAGGGMLAGRLLSRVFRRTPPSLSDRAQRQALTLAHDVQKYARNTGKAAGRKTREQRKALERSAQAVEHALEDRAKHWGVEAGKQAQELGEKVSAISEDVSRQALRAGKAASETSARTADRVQESAARASDSIRRKIYPRKTMTDKALDVVKTALVAVAATRVGRWMK